MALGLVAAVLASPVWAGAPNDINLQGRLFDNAGDPLPGPVNLTVRIYDQLADGTLLFLEDHAGTALEDGTFSILIGTGSVLIGSLDADTFSGVDRYLELVVNGDVLEPRQPFSSTAYALQSQAAETAVSAEFIGALGEGEIQQVISSSCGPGTFLTGIEADGSITCEAESGGSGDITDVTAGTGLTGGGTTGSVTLNADTAFLQRRVSSSCTAGSSIRAISETGTVTCESVGDVTAVIAGTGLTGGGTSGSVTVNADTNYLQRRVSSSCTAGSSIRAISATGTVTCETDTASEPHTHVAADLSYGCGTYAPANFCPNSLNNGAGPNCDDVPAGAFCEADGECGLSTAPNCPDATAWYFKLSE